MNIINKLPFSIRLGLSKFFSYLVDVFQKLAVKMIEKELKEDAKTDELAAKLLSKVG